MRFLIFVIDDNTALAGPDEMAQGMVTVKALREVGAAQETRALGQTRDWAKSLQSTA